MRWFCALVLALCVSVAVGAASPVDGKWAFAMDSPMGSVAAAVTFTVNGETLAGEFDLGGGRTWKVEQGSVKGEEIRFTINRDRPSGGSMSYEMKGTLKGDTISGEASAMGTTVPWTITRQK
jgi:hypothetical protein